MTRLVTSDETSIDLLIASSGVEFEVVVVAEPLEVLKKTILPVARIGYLIALKLLSGAPGQKTNHSDLRNLAHVTDKVELQRAREAVRLVVERGYSRDRDVESDLKKLHLA